MYAISEGSGESAHFAQSHLSLPLLANAISTKRHKCAGPILIFITHHTGNWLIVYKVCSNTDPKLT